MKRPILVLLALVAVAGVVTAWVRGRQDPHQVLPPLPAHATGVRDVVHAVPFRVAAPFTHWYRAEQPTVAAGWLLVLRVDPALVVPRDDFESVLYVGAETAERVNKGHLDGMLVVVVPSPAGADGYPARDPGGAPMWFGGAELPERVDAGRVAAELETARRDGVLPLAAERWAAARQDGGAPLDLPDRVALEQHAARLVQRFAPGEVDLANGLLVPYER